MAWHQEPADAQWIRSAVAEYERPLTLYALRIVGDVDIARDVVQDTFLRLCGQERFDLAPHLAEWLYAVCRNRAVDIVRKRGRMTSMPEGQAEDRADPQPPPWRLVEDRESAGQALRLISSLPPRQQEVLLLKFQHGLSYKQIAHVTGLSVSNVGFLIHTAVKALRQKLGGNPRSESPEKVQDTL
jgi:RNA polymerase sigma factor (sigma-70 family)